MMRFEMGIVNPPVHQLNSGVQALPARLR